MYIEIIRNGWTVKDYQSFHLRSHLTKKSFVTMVEYAVSHYNLGARGGQNFFVSDTLIEELLSLDAFLQEESNSSVPVIDRLYLLLTVYRNLWLIWRTNVIDIIDMV